MSLVGDQLRQARERQQLTIYQIADATKIKTDYLRAIEAGNWRIFMAPVYVKGFVRSYAQTLKLDLPKLMEGLEQELALTAEMSAPPSLSGRRKGPVDYVMLQLSRINWRVALPILGVLFLGGIAFLIWQSSGNRQRVDPLNKLGSGLSQPNRTRLPGTLPLPTNVPPVRR